MSSVDRDIDAVSSTVVVDSLGYDAQLPDEGISCPLIDVAHIDSGFLVLLPMESVRIIILTEWMVFGIPITLGMILSLRSSRPNARNCKARQV